MDDGPLEALKMLGASEAQLAELREWLTARNKDFAVWPENRRPLAVAQAMATQWRAGMGGYIGFDYAVLPWVMKQLGIKKAKHADTFAGLQVVEREALTLMAEKA